MTPLRTLFKAVGLALPGLCLLLVSLASAGPNAGGVLMIHATGIMATDNFCDVYTNLPECDEVVTQIPAASSAANWAVLAFFPPAGAPRLSGIAFGVGAYDESQIFVTDFGTCGDVFELSTDGWPAPNSGTAVTWNTPQTAYTTLVYWFAGYEYYGSNLTFDLTPHPNQGAFFADDSIPSELDPIAALGSLGFNDEPGHSECAGDSIQPGACCFPDCSCVYLLHEECEAAGGFWQGEFVPCDPNPCSCAPLGACCTGSDCVMRTEAECSDVGGTYHGDGTFCAPDPCPPTPVLEQSWGGVKARYR